MVKRWKPGHEWLMSLLWPQIRSSTSLSSASEGFFAAVMQHFSASVHLDVEAQVAGTPGSDSQAFCHLN